MRYGTRFNPLTQSGNYTYRPFEHSDTLHFLHIVQICYTSHPHTNNCISEQHYPVSPYKALHSEPRNELPQANYVTFSLMADNGDPGSIPDQSMWNLLWTKWHSDRFLSQYFNFPCQYHSTNAPYPFIHLPPTLHNFFLPVFQFSPVSNIPPMLHTHSFTYHPRCIMFFYQYFTFPLSVSFHQCSIPNHSPTTHAV